MWTDSRWRKTNGKRQAQRERQKLMGWITENSIQHLPSLPIWLLPHPPRNTLQTKLLNIWVDEAPCIVSVAFPHCYPFGSTDIPPQTGKTNETLLQKRKAIRSEQLLTIGRLVVEIRVRLGSRGLGQESSRPPVPASFLPRFLQTCLPTENMQIWQC